MRVRRLAASPNSPKSFRGHGVFLGEITDISPERWYTVKYSEGDILRRCQVRRRSRQSRGTREKRRLTRRRLTTSLRERLMSLLVHWTGEMCLSTGLER